MKSVTTFLCGRRRWLVPFTVLAALGVGSVSESAASSPAARAKDKLVGMRACSLAGKRLGIASWEHAPVFDQFWADMKATAKIDNTGLSVDVIDAGGSSSQQLENAQQFISQGYNAVFFIAGSPAGWNALAKTAAASHVLLFNHSSFAVTGAAQNVLIDHYQAGFLVGQAAGRWVKTVKHGEAQVGVPVVLTDPGLHARSTGFEAGIRSIVPHVKIWPEVSVTSGSASSIADSAQNLIQAHPGINVIFSYGDEFIPQIVTVFKEAGKVGPKQAWVGGVDGTTPVLKSIKADNTAAQASAAFPFRLSAVQSERDIEKALCGQKVLPTRVMEPQVATPKTVGSLLATQTANPLSVSEKSLYAKLMKYYKTPTKFGGKVPGIGTK